MTIDENEIIRIYGKRWDIEVFFKTCKSFLKLGTEYHGLSYDALTAHTAFVFLLEFSRLHSSFWCGKFKILTRKPKIPRSLI
ncbi:hypothetical protein BC336_1095 [Lactobacillus delbrueckii subsp. bulgaricus]|nr:hypothetical protein [Lactobacillus delbrueckii]AXI15171.1 hypothetical protein BC336_1095 [Lactobacillus delbrueckii subsp. bulgaricus]EHE89058.1 hypothetical protein LDBUL1632_01080 [Lactobacillus delbrueckii subsp. bulgaricus CNCM I-1632]